MSVKIKNLNFTCPVYPPHFILAKENSKIRQWQTRLEDINIPERELLQKIKRFILQFSIFKGHFLGFSMDQKLFSPIELVAYLKTQPATNTFIIETVIEFSEIPIEQSYIIITHKKTALGEFLKIASPEKIKKLNQRVARDLSYTSNKIEGNNMTITDTNDVINHPEKEYFGEQLEILSHYQLNLKVLENPPKQLTDITPELLFEYHKKIAISDLTDDRLGRYRDKNIMVLGTAKKFANWEQVPQLMDDFFKWLYSQNGRTDFIRFASEVHFKLVDIHPFFDGNGRVSRLIMNLILLMNGYPMVSIMHTIVEIYYAAMKLIDYEKNYALLDRILAEGCLRSLDIAFHYLK